MTPLEIAKKSAEAAQSCFMYYCGKKMSDQTIEKIAHLVYEEDPQQSDIHAEYAKEYGKRSER